MKAVFEKIGLSSGQSFTIRSLHLAEFDAPWHFHPEVELTYIQKSKGTRLVGDSMEEYSENDLVLLGPNLPHIWQNPAGQKGHSEAVVVQFPMTLLNESLQHLPEFTGIRQLLDRSKNGVHFLPETSEKVGRIMGAMVNMSPFERLVALLNALQVLATSPGGRMLASHGYTHQATIKDAEQMTVVFEHVRQHFGKPITLETVAELVHKTPPAFCRFFKRRSRKTFFEFLNEFRVGNACRLLATTDWGIGQICHESGYLNIPHFNKQFKKTTGRSPSEFRKQHLKSTGARP